MPMFREDNMHIRKLTRSPQRTQRSADTSVRTTQPSATTGTSRRDFVKSSAARIVAAAIAPATTDPQLCVGHSGNSDTRLPT